MKPAPPAELAGAGFIFSRNSGFEMMSTRKKNLYLALIILLGLLLLAGGALTHAQEASIDRRILARAESVTGDRFNASAITPRGAQVFAIRRPRAEMLRAIDDGLTELFAVARKHGYRARLEHSAYTIFIARPDRSVDSRGAYSPDIAVPAEQYAGSVYDQGGFVYAAGKVLEFNNCVFIIAEHERDFRRVSDVVRYEGEHLILYHNDRALYQRTADHSRGGGHPILQ